MTIYFKQNEFYLSEGEGPMVMRIDDDNPLSVFEYHELIGDQPEYVPATHEEYVDWRVVSDAMTARRICDGEDGWLFQRQMEAYKYNCDMSRRTEKAHDNAWGKIPF